MILAWALNVQRYGGARHDHVFPHHCLGGAVCCPSHDREVADPAWTPDMPHFLGLAFQLALLGCSGGIASKLLKCSVVRALMSHALASFFAPGFLTLLLCDLSD